MGEYPGKTPPVLHGLALEVPLRQGWKAAHTPAVVACSPKLDEQGKPNPIPEIKDIKSDSHDYTKGTWTTRCSLLTSGFHKHQAPGFLAKGTGSCEVIEMKIPLMCVALRSAADAAAISSWRRVVR